MDVQKKEVAEEIFHTLYLSSLNKPIVRIMNEERSRVRR
jgi:hypothetical protein